MRLLVNLLIIILIFVNIQQFLNSLLPAYKNYLNVVQKKNEVFNKLKKVETIGKLFDKFRNEKSTEISSIAELEKSGQFDILLPKKFNDYELTLIINSIFRNSGFNDINIYQFEESKIKHPQLDSLELVKENFSFKITGNYDNLFNLIKNFENHTRFFEFNSLNLTKAEENILLNANVGTYYLGEAKLAK